MAKESSVVYVCDKCGCTHTDPTHDERREWWQVKRDVFSSDPELLLCTPCLKLLKEWVKEKNGKSLGPSAVGLNGPFR